MFEHLSTAEKPSIGSSSHTAGLFAMAAAAAETPEGMENILTLACGRWCLDSPLSGFTEFDSPSPPSLLGWSWMIMMITIHDILFFGIDASDSNCDGQQCGCFGCLGGSEGIRGRRLHSRQLPQIC